MFECHAFCADFFLDIWMKYFVDACVFNDDTTVLYIVFMSTNITDVVGSNGCKVSMQLFAIRLSLVLVFMMTVSGELHLLFLYEHLILLTMASDCAVFCLCLNLKKNCG